MTLKEQLMWYDALEHVCWQLGPAASLQEIKFFNNWFLEMCKGWSLAELLVKARAKSNGGQ